MGLGLEAEKSKNSALNYVSSLRELVAVACTREAEIFPNALAASRQMARATAALSQVCDTISTQSKELLKSSQ